MEKTYQVSFTLKIYFEFPKFHGIFVFHGGGLGKSVVVVKKVYNT